MPWSPSASDSSPAVAALEARVRALAREHTATPKFDFDSRVRPLLVAYNRDPAWGRTGVVSLRARDVRVVDAETGELVASGVAGGGRGGGDEGEGGEANGGADADGKGGNRTLSPSSPSSPSSSSPSPWVDFGLRSASTLVDLGDGELEIVEFAWDNLLASSSSSASSSSDSASASPSQQIKASRTGGGGLQLFAPLGPSAPGAMPYELTAQGGGGNGCARPLERPAVLERLAVQVTLDARAAGELLREKGGAQGWVARQAAADATVSVGAGATKAKKKKAAAAVGGKISMSVLFSSFSFFGVFFF